MIDPGIHVDELIEKYPQLSVFLSRRGVVCVQCGEVFWGTLRELLESKGLDVNEMVGEINAELES